MDKTATIDELSHRASTASSIFFGGGGLVRKPMLAAAAIALAADDPHAVHALLGGPEVDLMIGLGKVASLHFAYMGMDEFGLTPNFRKVREHGHLDVVEASEYLVLGGLDASARGVPFMPTRSALGTDVLTRPNTPYRQFPCPLTGEQLVAAPALRPALSVIHVNVADRRGNAVIQGEVFADLLLARASESVWVTAEEVVDSLPPIDARDAGWYLPRLWVDGVVHAPGGADFTGTYPSYPVDRARAGDYARRAADPGWLQQYAEGLLADHKERCR